MSLPEIYIQDHYRSDRNNLIQDFYIPCLSETILYSRAVGYFSSTSIVAVAQGLAALIDAGGKMRLVASPCLSDENIWVIFGNNGFGKTSLLEGILWCLYGVKAIYPDKRKQPKFATFFNSIAIENNPNLEMSVTLTFKQNREIYRITRRAISF